MDRTIAQTKIQVNSLQARQRGVVEGSIQLRKGLELAHALRVAGQPRRTTTRFRGGDAQGGGSVGESTCCANCERACSRMHLDACSQR